MYPLFGPPPIFFHCHSYYSLYSRNKVPWWISGFLQHYLRYLVNQSIKRKMHRPNGKLTAVRTVYIHFIYFREFFKDNVTGGDMQARSWGHKGIPESRLQARHYAICIYCWTSKEMKHPTEEIGYSNGFWLKKVVKLNSTHFQLFFHTLKFCNANNINTASQAVCNVYCLYSQSATTTAWPAPRLCYQKSF